MVLHDLENPLSNSAAELRFKLLKNETWVRKKYSKANRYVKKTIKDTHERILNYEFPTNFKKNRKRKSKVTIEDQEEDVDCPSPPKKKVVAFQKPPIDDEFPAKRKVVEIWKGSTTRLPGGFYSRRRALTYAANLVKRSKQASTRLAQWRQKKNAKKGQKQGPQQQHTVSTE